MKHYLRALCVFSLFAVSVLPAHAQADYPTKAITLLVPFPAGGSTDVLGRYLGNELSKRIGVPVIIENRGGASGAIGALHVAKSAADGYTILLATGGAITIAPNKGGELPYDPINDFTPIALIADTPMSLSVRAESPYQSIADIVADAQQRPDTVSIAIPGIGTVSHLLGELFAQTADISLRKIPYQGAAPAMTDVLAGQVDLIVSTIASIDPLLANGSVRTLATFTKAEAVAGVPVIREQTGFEDLEVQVWVGLLAPAQTPEAVISRLSDELLAICNTPETEEYFTRIGAQTACGGPEVLATTIDSDFLRWKNVIEQGGIKLD